MRVQFEFTQDDVLDVHKRIMARSKVARSWRWQDLILAAVVLWIIVFLFFIKTPLKAVIFASFVTVVTALLFPGIYKRGVDKRMRRFLREKIGDTNSFICEVELTPAGVWTRQIDTQLTFEWQSIAEILVTEDSVDIFTNNGGGVVVRKRAFKSPEEQKEFVDLAKRYFDLSRQAPSTE